MPEALPVFTCPRCGSVSHHPEDIRHGYCGNCHAFTAPTQGYPSPGDTQTFVDGIVSHRDHEPYVRISINGERVQLNLAEAFKIARDILISAARIEADAMIFKFFIEHDLPQAAAGMLMQDFREYRLRQERKPVSGSTVDPDSGESTPDV